MSKTKQKDQEGALVQGQLRILIESSPPGSTPAKEFWGAQFDLGLAWVQFPLGSGGLGVSPGWQIVVDSRITAVGGSVQNRQLNIAGIGLAAGTLAEHGTEEQCRRLLRPLFTTEEIWCQLFSEPGAGSDLAAVSTSAISEDGVWIVNGQKVWTSLGHVARWGMLIARTNPELPKHAGLTYFILDMESDGVEVRPLYQITADAEFNEVFFDNVRVSDSLRVGAVGGGWSVALTTLMNERSFLGGQIGERGSGAIAHAVAAWEQSESNDESVRDALIRFWIEAEAMRLTALRARESATRGTPGPEGSIGKLHWADLNESITSFTIDLLGAAGMTYPPGYQFKRPGAITLASDDIHKAYLRSRANSIEGGTSEIMKNIVGERVLGLPSEPRVDKDLAWREIPRGRRT